MKCIAALTLLLTTLTAAATAQTGVLDQSNPFPPPPPTQTAGYNGDTSSLIWQQEVQTGVAGQLEGVNVYLNGAVGSSFNLRLRAGGGFSSSPALFQTLVTKSTNAFPETVFVNCSAANLQFAQGALFVIEIQGTNTGGGFSGTYTPPPTAPTYPRPLYLGSSACFADCGWRLSFDTFMLTTPTPTNYCTAGTTTNGCNATISASAQPSASQASPCTLTVANVEGQKQGLVFYGLDNSSFTPLPWGTGTSWLCVKAPTQRTPNVSTGGLAGACNGVITLDWDAYLSANPSTLGAPFSAGQKIYAQAWFRDPPAPKTTNLSDAVELTVQP
jgi:hypothetical protein